jgi:hypothetical protein
VNEFKSGGAVLEPSCSSELSNNSCPPLVLISSLKVELLDTTCLLLYAIIIIIILSVSLSLSQTPTTTLSHFQLFSFFSSNQITKPRFNAQVGGA